MKCTLHNSSHSQQKWSLQLDQNGNWSINETNVLCTENFRRSRGKSEESRLFQLKTITFLLQFRAKSMNCKSHCYWYWRWYIYAEWMRSDQLTFVHCRFVSMCGAQSETKSFFVHALHTHLRFLWTVCICFFVKRARWQQYRRRRPVANNETWLWVTYSMEY